MNPTDPMAAHAGEQERLRLEIRLATAEAERDAALAQRDAAIADRGGRRASETWRRWTEPGTLFAAVGLILAFIVGYVELQLVPKLDERYPLRCVQQEKDKALEKYMVSVDEHLASIESRLARREDRMR